MKKILYLFFIFYGVSLSAQGKKFFESGEVKLNNTVEKINSKFANSLLSVQVNINGKSYNFMFDTGAPTVISSEIYRDLGLEKKHKRKVKDSQKNKQEQVFTYLPEMVIDNVTFENVGAIVMDLNASELGCYKIDGIIGANQMAKLFWRINYSENSLEVSKDLAGFDLNGYDFVLPFDPELQKTPIVETRISGKKIDLTFDTGFVGRIKVTDNNYDPRNSKFKSIETYGANSVGAYGAAKPAVSYLFKADALSLGNKTFQNELISPGNSNLIGNEFFKDFAFIMDWKNNKIYMKRIKNDPVKLESFGFGYRFIDAKPVVTYLFKEENFPLKMGDSILSINNVDLDHLDKESACHYFINRVEKDAGIIDVKIRREGNIMDVKLNKKEYLR